MKKPHVSFRESFLSSDRQGGGATVLREGCDIVIRKTCLGGKGGGGGRGE
jgi:hypothetical protein